MSPFPQTPLSHDNTQDNWENAHQIPDADAFLPHFERVLQVPGMTKDEAQKTCTWSESDDINFQYSAGDEWMVEEKSEEEIDQRRGEWHDFIASKLLPWNEYKHRFVGRGIVMVAGSHQKFSIERVRVILRQLRHLSSTIPIEIHYWGDEMSDDVKANLTQTWPLLFWNDLSDRTTNIIQTEDRTPFINYQFKSVALVNSRFAEPLLLDADNIPVVDPLDLYESDTYKEFGTIFWPDIARTRPQNPAWRIFNTACRMDEYEMESGQLYVDKRRYWYHLQLAAWLNNDDVGWYYTTFLLGDKDIFRFAWHALKTRYGRPKKWITSVGTVAGGWFCGHTFGQHHPNGQIAFMHGGLLKTMNKAVLKWHREQNGGIFQSYKQSSHNEDPSYLERVHILWDGADYLPDSYRPQDGKELEVGSCTNFMNVDARPLSELHPGMQENFEKIGGYFFADEPEPPAESSST